ncbi:MAG: TIGR01777 family oxidoreductase [Phycisphaeraceae bacterium]|nr:TIGR01777 family oxidoreductase [Phycisphaeraceae bacterium]
MSSVLDLRSTMPAPRRALFDFHASPGAFERLAPPWETIRVVERTGSIREGDRLVMRLKKGPLSLPWEARHFGFVEGERFRDEQVRGPFASWVHTHAFEEHPSGDDARSVLHDRIEYALPGGTLGNAIGGGLARKQLVRMFAFRHLRTARDLARHERFAREPRLTIGVTGASGSLGSSLVGYLASAGHSMIRFVRREPREDAAALGREAFWDPRAGVIDQRSVEECDALIHLAGEPIPGRWTASKRDAIERSRSEGTAHIADALARAERADAKGRALLSASAVGFYGHRPGETLDETSRAGDDFRARVCVAWERATSSARDAGARVALLRIGNVVGTKTPLLARLLTPWKFGLGGAFGAGAQGFPWIGLDDFVGATEFVLHTPSLVGPVNLVAPQPVTNRDFARSLARALRRPALGVYPAWALRLALGGIADEALLSDQRVRPATLERAGFGFLTPTLDEALRWELGLVGERDLDALAP